MPKKLTPEQLYLRTLDKISYIFAKIEREPLSRTNLNRISDLDLKLSTLKRQFLSIKPSINKPKPSPKKTSRKSKSEPNEVEYFPSDSDFPFLR
jgi:hypothetical protein